jgi:hypothetical protein
MTHRVAGPRMEQATRPVRLYYNGNELKDCSVIIQYQMTKCNGEGVEEWR